ncbi:MAG: hypothetical protein FD170_3681 [Bacteroidetes bacterium]|nr:MAG: hypothetical protein FD170_3681 [Bacteroidota bacterium]
MKSIFRASVYLLILPFVFTSCSTASLQMQILKPATINVPAEIKQVGIINRSLPEKGQGAMNVLEGLVTGESIGADREGSQECMRGLAAGLNANPRFTAVLIEGVEFRGTGTRQWPEFLDWKQVEELCERFRVDAIVALETFDSDVELRKSSADVERTIDKKKVIVKEYYADLRMIVRSGWTIYKPQGRQIIDRNSFNDEMRWSESGDTPDEVLGKLPSKRRSINESGYYSGRQYGVRISPTWVNENRSYFRKANDDFKIASKYVKQDRWNDAIAIWKKYTLNPDPKVAGRAAYNMALASEVEGNLSLALEWANRAWQQHGLKKARHYTDLLNMRIREQERLDQQMAE